MSLPLEALISTTLAFGARSLRHQRIESAGRTWRGLWRPYAAKGPSSANDAVSGEVGEEAHGRKHALVGGAPAAASAIVPGATVALAVLLLLVARLRVRTDDSLAMEMPLLPGTLWRPVSLRLLVVLTCE